MELHFLPGIWQMASIGLYAVLTMARRAARIPNRMEAATRAMVAMYSSYSRNVLSLNIVPVKTKYTSCPN
jgi:hypothetical protein